LTPRELAEQVAAARNFVPPLSRFIIATTGPSDVHVQEAARSFTEKHVKQGLFTVEVWSWVEIWAELNRRPRLLQAIGPIYWPRLFLLAEQTGSHIGGVHISGGTANIQGDVVARDKISQEALRPGVSALHQLPSPPADFTGRIVELAELLEAIRKNGVI